jgi:hypothetical protein
VKLWRRNPGPTEGEQARKRAEEALTRTMAETPMFAALGASLRELREENHFAQKIRESMRPR